MSAETRLSLYADGPEAKRSSLGRAADDPDVTRHEKEDSGLGRIARAGRLVRVGRSWYAGPMSRLSDEITKALQPGMVVPAPLEQLFTWMETTGRVSDHGDGRLVGCLHSAEEHRTGWTDTERRGGTSRGRQVNSDARSRRSRAGGVR
jgi:hypothetical protein